ncbi:hypothetical protein WR25_02463 [Diploscapter pachys]|uniref:Peptidase M13 C-terminal domain-containing protein n=1 Tax=Diploscapter pachys TaxID=2018661 RepID=A0A2A2KKU7_9BILA|nr:hypothetical protein WR25_02463 [Diploscapter pachys]
MPLVNYSSFLVAYRSDPPSSNIFKSSQNSLTHLLESEHKASTSSFDPRSQNGIASSTIDDEDEERAIGEESGTGNGMTAGNASGRQKTCSSSTAKTALLQRTDSSQKLTSGRTNSRKTRLIIAACLFFLLTLLFAVAIVAYLTSPCTSRACVLTASQILSKMDESIAPCEDFYHFACGNWIKSSVNLNYDMWNALYETSIGAHNTLVDAILKVIKNESRIQLNKGEMAAVELFKQCTDMEKLSSIGLSTWLQFADDLGGWLQELIRSPNNRRGSSIRLPPHLLEDSILKSFKYSVFPLFWAGVEELPIARILQVIGQEMASLLSIDSNNTRIKQHIAEMIEFEYKITLSGSTFYAGEQRERYEIVTLGELQAIAPAIDWHYFLSALVGIDLPVNEQIALKSHEHIALKTGREWLVKLSDILKEYSSTQRGLSIIRNYIKWKLLFFHLAYVKPRCAEGDLWTVLKMYSGPAHLRKEFCILRASGIFPISLPSILRKVDGIEKSDKNREYVLKMASNIKQEYAKRLSESEVLDNKTSVVVFDKIQNLNILASYPEKINDENEMLKESERISTELFWSMVKGAGEVYKEKLARLRKPVDQGDWVDSRPALSLTPIHNYERNLIQIPFDVVRAPYMDAENFLDFMNYATLGTTISHELTHAYDRQGKLHGPTGNLGKYWSKFSMRKVEEKEKCLLKQYEELIGKKEDAEKSLYENIADLEGLTVSYRAWNKLHSSSWQKIVGLEKYSTGQLFFVAYAQGWCAHRTTKSREVHSPEDIRVLGALQNSKAFAETFGCPSNTKMNPIKKCSLW